MYSGVQIKFFKGGWGVLFEVQNFSNSCSNSGAHGYHRKGEHILKPRTVDVAVIHSVDLGMIYSVSLPQIKGSAAEKYHLYRSLVHALVDINPDVPGSVKCQSGS